jgi:hypothetical protein
MLSMMLLRMSAKALHNDEVLTCSLRSHENDDWKKTMTLPAKDTRPQTEVSASTKPQETQHERQLTQHVSFSCMLGCDSNQRQRIRGLLFKTGTTDGHF